ncbi:MAG: protein-disulfide reductase DsbD family protein [Gammaproteobacteria bacterium]|nr:protein-disulfide reductase DsbD family protein [Gammaproteobacteria bacterium]MDE0252695.1 protein-disulfide reductase DsbD family protein [Gammaproteobacteria bacterium]MDE0402383.1 protein-disulfide reductase DsbD family protein [Gammaproteobacteria bacterium]
MKSFSLVAAQILVTVMLLGVGFGLHAQPQNQVAYELISEVRSIAPDQAFDVAIKLDPKPGWHIYWINPGDNGQAPRVSWELPEGFTAGEFQYQVPHFVPFQGTMSYGYDDETLFLVTIQPGSDIAETNKLSGKVSWLACDDSICLPGNGNVSLNLPKGDGQLNSKWKSDFQSARDAHPTTVDWSSSYTATEEEVVLDVDLPFEVSVDSEVWLFPTAKKLIDHAKPQKVHFGDRSLRIQTPAGARYGKYEKIKAVLRIKNNEGETQHYQFESEHKDHIGVQKFGTERTRSPFDK